MKIITDFTVEAKEEQVGGPGNYHAFEESMRH